MNQVKTVSEILADIYKSGCEQEVFLVLSQELINEQNRIKQELAGKNATIRLIGKITKDKTVRNILDEE